MFTKNGRVCLSLPRTLSLSPARFRGGAALLAVPSADGLPRLLGTWGETRGGTQREREREKCEREKLASRSPGPSKRAEHKTTKLNKIEEAIGPNSFLE